MHRWHLWPFTRVNTETDNSGCLQTEPTKQVKDNEQYSWTKKTNFHSRKRTVDNNMPGMTYATKSWLLDVFKGHTWPIRPLKLATLTNKINYSTTFPHVEAISRSNMTDWRKRKHQWMIKWDFALETNKMWPRSFITQKIFEYYFLLLPCLLLLSPQ